MNRCILCNKEVERDEGYYDPVNNRWCDKCALAAHQLDPNRNWLCACCTAEAAEDCEVTNG